MIIYLWIVSGIIVWICFYLNFKGNIGVLIQSKMCKLPTAVVSEHISPIKKYFRYDLHRGGRFTIEKPNPSTIARVKQLGIQKCRGFRGGHARVKHMWDTNQGVNINILRTLPVAITTVVQNRSNSCFEHIFKIPKTNSNFKRVKCQPNSITKGQTSLKMCCINPKSVINKTFALSDYIISNSFDIVAVTETWLGSAVDKACINEHVPCGYQIKHVPRIGSWCCTNLQV